MAWYIRAEMGKERKRRAILDCSHNEREREIPNLEHSMYKPLYSVKVRQWLICRVYTELSFFTHLMAKGKLSHWRIGRITSV